MPKPRSHRLLLVALLVPLALGACARAARPDTREPDRGARRAGTPEARDFEIAEGKASWYGGSFHGRLTANGERFNKEALTAAHRKLPFNTCVRVRNLDNGREVEVRINDRGPYAGGRIIDLSEAAARRLGFIEQGVATVELSPCR